MFWISSQKLCRRYGGEWKWCLCLERDEKIPENFKQVVMQEMERANEEWIAGSLEPWLSIGREKMTFKPGHYKDPTGMTWRGSVRGA